MTETTPPFDRSQFLPDRLHAGRTRRLLLVALAAAMAGAAYGWHWWAHDRFQVRTDNAYVAGNLISVKAQATGIIAQVLAEETQFVKKGDLLFHLQEHLAKAALGKARGELGQTVRRIAALYATRRQLGQKLTAREARLALVRHDVVRYRQAAPAGAVSRQILENALDQMQALEAEVQETRAELETIKAHVDGTTVMAHPAVELAAHQFIEAYLEYVRQQIRAPVSGYVANRRAQVDDRVHPGDTLMTIVPLDHLWVEANLRETELRDVRPGQPATVTVDLYGDHQTYRGVVEGLVPGTGSAFALLPPDNATGNFIHIVERVPVRIALSQEELEHHPLRPGLSTVTSIDVSQAGQSVWTSMATASGQEYGTDIYAEEFEAAQAMAEGIIETNVTQGGSARADNPAMARQDGASGEWRPPRHAGSVPDRTTAPREGSFDDWTGPASKVPPRSPDLGSGFAPLSPSIGPGSGGLGPEAGPGFSGPGARRQPADRR